METLTLPWLFASIAIPALGAVLAWRLDAEPARRVTLGATVLALGAALGAALAAPRYGAARDPFDPVAALGGPACLVIDELSTLLLPFAALLFVITVLTVPRTDRRRGSQARLLAAEALTLATFACTNDVALAALWVAALLPLEAELRSGGVRGARVVRIYMLASAVLFVAGVAAVHRSGLPPAVATALLLGAVMIRKGIVPLHSWIPALFEHGPLPAAVLFVTPQLGTYAAVRLIAPTAPTLVLTLLGSASLITAVYAAGLALVQTEGRRAFAWLFMSQSALVLAGVECSSVTGLAGGLSLWISSSLSLAGFGMTLCVLEARRGHVSLLHHSGGYESTPMLATSFLLLGLCSVGFPGTLGFVGAELLVDGSVGAHPQVGIAAVVATVLNGITVLRMFFLLLCGVRRPPRPELRLRPREHAAFALLVGVLVLGGLVPQPLLDGRGRAAARVMESRRVLISP